MSLIPRTPQRQPEFSIKLVVDANKLPTFLVE